MLKCDIAPERPPRSTTSPLTELGDDVVGDLDLTPRTANKIAQAADASSASKKKKSSTKPLHPSEVGNNVKKYKQIVDSVTELQQPRNTTTNANASGESQSQSQYNVLGAMSLSSRQERIDQGLLNSQQRFLPNNVIQMRLQEIEEDPAAHFFAGMNGFITATTVANKENRQGESFYAGPPGLPEQLQDLFKFSFSRDGNGKAGLLLAGATGPKRFRGQQDEVSRKRPRVTAEAEKGRDTPGPEIELGRERASSMSHHDGIDMLDFGGPQNASIDNDFALDLDLGDTSHDTSAAHRFALERTPSRLGTPMSSSRLGTPAGLAGLDGAINLDFEKIDRANMSVLNVFDSATKQRSNGRGDAVTSTPRSVRRLVQIPGLEEEERREDDTYYESQLTNATITSSSTSTMMGKEGRGRTGGWSRNTVKAIRILEHELAPSVEDEEGTSMPSHQQDPAKQLSFNTLSDKASRRGAASMFFEMLILGTRDCITLKQEEAYGDIQIQAKEKLWDVTESLDKLALEEKERIEREGSVVSQRSAPARESSVLSEVQSTPKSIRSGAGRTPWQTPRRTVAAAA